MSLSALTQRIIAVDEELKVAASKAVNMLLTMRNWMIGFYLVEYEQDGEERAKYGAGLINSVAKNLTADGMSARNLRLYRRFFLVYTRLAPEIQDSISKKIWQSPIAKFDMPNCQRIGSFCVESELVDSSLHLPPEKLLSSLSFTHFTLLLAVTDPLQRSFYELETITCTWTVSELKRQINSLLFERSGISRDPRALMRGKISKTKKLDPQAYVRDIYTFEFLGIPAYKAVSENNLEKALLDHIQEFIIELGHGFCFEGRQKRILIGDEYFFIDLLFYHRILKCHILIELKIEEFNFGNAGQLNAYLNYFKMELKEESDNDPIGILLVANKNDTLVKYATAGLDQNLFVSKYL
ncbi:MAG TPA: DUF1016 family protein, partial [Bacteroidetes bacterium]|nr:DUF1016 family protein [Bacteroidota bacterium]